MNNIKYIFRDFRWTVVKLDTKKHWYVAQLAEIYETTKNEIRESLSAPMAKFRRWEIDEDKLRQEFSVKSWKDIKPECLKLFHKKEDIDWIPYKSIVKFKEKLQKLWYKNIILSDEVPPQWKNVEELWRYDWFDDRILSHEIWLSKYDDVENNTTNIFDYALKKYWIQWNEAVFVDDLEKNCIVANKLWIKTILAQNTKQTIKDIKTLLDIN